MSVDLERLRVLVAEIGRFHLRAGALSRAQERIAQALRRDETVSPQEAESYLAAARRYFTEFEREADGHLRDVEKRLAHVSQVQFNLTAEREVAVRRIEATRGVLDGIANVSGGERHQGA